MYVKVHTCVNFVHVNCTWQLLSIYIADSNVQLSDRKSLNLNEPRREKTCFCPMRTTKAQIRLLFVA